MTFTSTKLDMMVPRDRMKDKLLQAPPLVVIFFFFFMIMIGVKIIVTVTRSNRQQLESGIRIHAHTMFLFLIIIAMMAMMTILVNDPPPVPVIGHPLPLVASHSCILATLFVPSSSSSCCMNRAGEQAFMNKFPEEDEDEDEDDEDRRRPELMTSAQTDSSDIRTSFTESYTKS